MPENQAPMIASAKPYFAPDEVDTILDIIRDVLQSGAMTGGPHVREFEDRFAEYCGCKHAVAVGSGTAALEIMLRQRKLEGGEVIVSTNTFLASATSVVVAGGRPVLCDIDPRTLCMSLDTLRARVSSRTRGVMIVHIAGLICPDTAEIRSFCAERGLFLFEDAAHAHGATMHGAKAGSLCDAGAFSFFPTKPMAVGEGGMITTDDDSLDTYARTWRNHGVPEGERVHHEVGLNDRLDEIRAILGLSQLRTLESMLTRRREIAARYTEALAGMPHIEVLGPPEGFAHSYFKFPILVDEVGRRQQLGVALREKHRVATGTVYWPACHPQPLVQERPDLYDARGPFPVADEVLPRVICLPIHPQLSDEDVDRVVEGLCHELGR